MLLFIVAALSLIFAISNVLIYNLANNTFVESEKDHIAVISESLSPKVGVWYFINSEADSSEMDKFLQNAVNTYKLEYLAFRDENGLLVSEISTPEYISGDAYNVEHKKNVYSPENNDFQNIIGTIEVASTNHILKELYAKYTTMGVLIIILLALYLYLEMRLLKELLTPLNRIAAGIKGYMPGDKLLFESFSKNKDDVIFEIINGFRQMQQNIDDAMSARAIEEESNRAKDAYLLKQSRFIEMGTMISNIAHQWKQPLNIIELSITDLTIKGMLGEVDSKYQNKLFSEIHKQVVFMSKTIDVFKNFLKEDYENKDMEIFSITKAIEESIQLLGSTLENNNIELKLNLDKKCFTYGSIGELEQVFLIILNNAVDAIIERDINGGKIIIECMIENEKNVIKINDNGGGFDSALVDKIFDAYFTTKHQSQGTGLGLFITKTIVEIKFNGTIEAKNFKDGALFVIKLPLLKMES
jgi:signal transduction histidine kinase